MPKTYGVVWRPTLDEVLNNIAPPPCTLSAFMNYLSQNHCLETLEFILEAKRYCESYRSSMESTSESIETTNGSANIDLTHFYQFLLTTYIMPGAAREVNLPVKIRDGLLRNKTTSTPPSPETLESAVRNIRDLIEESIFVSFLNSPSVYLCENGPLTVSMQNNSRPYLARNTSDSQPKEPVKYKRPSIKTLGRPWSWPPWKVVGW